ncbi:TIGR02186 family protein [Kiloniella sp. EL199]|uniref:TIGR02186 family protein n=1 Tax=Kiloniella sp. EL199 TaxID=2107581 RepID=UPI000EA09692|nr:TIGR02186 family protein [Kiloniella sp. EL199]
MIFLMVSLVHRLFFASGIDVLKVLVAVGFSSFFVLSAKETKAIEADLSSHLVAITAGFSGDRILLFGSINSPGEVIVVVRGPDTDFKVQRKGQVAGIWMNTASMNFESVPSFYSIASTGPIEEISSSATRALNAIGFDNIGLELPVTKAAGKLADSWKEALLRNLLRSGNYQLENAEIVFLGEHLFRTEFELPANVPTGTYSVSVYHLRDGQIIDARTTPLTVSKIGVEAEIYDYAHLHSAMYGVIAIVVALVSGWIGHLVFRKG